MFAVISSLMGLVLGLLSASLMNGLTNLGDPEVYFLDPFVILKVKQAGIKHTSNCFSISSRVIFKVI